jgi:hypothetical protein
MALELPYPAYVGGQVQYVQAVVAGLPATVRKGEFGETSVENAHGDDVTPYLLRERWLVNFQRYAPPKTSVFGLLWLPNVKPEELNERLSGDKREPKRCDFVGLCLDNKAPNLPLPQTADLVTMSGLSFATWFASYRFDFERLTLRRHRHGGHGGLKPCQYEENRCAWLFKDGNDYNTRIVYV